MCDSVGSAFCDFERGCGKRCLRKILKRSDPKTWVRSFSSIGKGEIERERMNKSHLQPCLKNHRIYLVPALSLAILTDPLLV
jgi:hypothetical protein